ncbi:MAG TPA: PAS domain-containing protein [Polyangiaceae bacterium]|nr:PAS domain-containing protein [Polyangiaceae bacterium]
MPSAKGERDSDDALLREVLALRAQVAEMQRAAARHVDTAGISLPEREELMREAERVAHLGTWTWDMESGRVTWSDELFRILGLEPGQSTPSVEAFFSAVHPADRERAMATNEQAIKDGVLPLVDCRIVRPDGSIRHTTASGTYLFDTSGKPRRVVGGVLDRTQSLEAEVKLRRALGLLEEAQRFARLGSWRFDPQTQETEWSHEFYRICGLPLDVTPSAERFMDCLVAEDQVRFRARYGETLTQPGGGEIEGRIRTPEGQLRHVRLRGELFQTEDGRQELRGTMLDVTDQIRMREELAHAQKMEAVGRLAGGIAHDFNNLLTAITGNLELLANRVGRAQELDDSLAALGSAAALTRRLLAFGRKAQLSLKLIEPNDLVRSTMALMQRLVGDEVRLDTELEPNLPRVNVDVLEIERALVNLVINARDVMPRGGVVRIATGQRRIDGVGFVELSVADEGPGIDERDLPHIFEPFYTTHQAQGGTGLGLATVLGTAEQHGGTVRVDARAGGGSVFAMLLPIAEPVREISPSSRRGSAEAGDAGEPPAERKARPLQLLVVDDEPMIATVTGRLLSSRGHQVRVVSDPKEALAIWAEHGKSIDLVICDVAMAEMRGPELIARLGESGVVPRVLFITGYSEEATRSALGHPVLAKPFTATALWKAVNELSDPGLPSAQ